MKIKKVKRKLIKILKLIFCVLYFSFTALVPICTFTFVFLQKGHIIYAVAISFVSFIATDIICSILEDLICQIHKLVLDVKKKKQKIKEQEKEKKEKEIKELEKLLLEKGNYNREIEDAKKECGKFLKKVKENNKQLPKEIYRYLCDICTKIENIIDVLERDTEEYYPIRHTFKVYFPEFRKITYQYIDIASGESLDKESTYEFRKLITEFNQYLDFVKASINDTDKISLNVGIKSLIKIMESERKKGEK